MPGFDPPLWLHVLLCLVVPAVWGVMMYFAFNALDKRRTKPRPEDPPPIDYSI